MIVHAYRDGWPISSGGGEGDYDMHESLLTNRCSVGTKRVPQIRKDLGHPAFVVTCANASLVGILSGARLTPSRQRSFARLPDVGESPSSQMTLCLELTTVRQAYPRAPPRIQVGPVA